MCIENKNGWMTFAHYSTMLDNKDIAISKNNSLMETIYSSNDMYDRKRRNRDDCKKVMWDVYVITR